MSGCKVEDKTVWQQNSDIVDTNLNGLERLLVTIVPVHFEVYFKHNTIVEPKQKHYLVAVIENLLDVAKDQKWDLVKQGDFRYFFNGNYWQGVSREDTKRFLMQVAIKQGYSEIESKGYEFLDKLFKQFIALAHLETKTKNINKVMINLQNGTFEVGSSIKLREFDKADFLTYQLPFSYNKNATAPKFTEFLNYVLPDNGCQKLLQEYCGYIFTKNLKLEKCLILYGTGANGKSVIVDIMNALLGVQNVTNYSLASLSQEHNRANIKDVLVNWGYEIHGNLDSDTFKNLTSGEPIQARLKYGNSFMMTDYAKLAFNANSLPKDVEHNEAFYRRFMIIPFEVTIPEGKRDANLAKDIITNELEGVFNWIVEGLKRLVDQKSFSSSAKSKDALEAYKKESDTVALFIDDSGYKSSLEKKSATKLLFAEYIQFCKDNGFRSLNIRNFSRRLQFLGFEYIKSNGFTGFYMTINSE